MITLNNCKNAVSNIKQINVRSISVFTAQLTAAKEDESDKPASFAELIEEEEVPDPKKFNKSRLLDQHRNLLNERNPYNEPQSWIHLREKYQCKLYGRFGADSGVNPRICFPTKQDLMESAEYERVAHPYTLQDMLQKIKDNKTAKIATIEKREMEIAAKIGKLEVWKKELYAKIAKKEADALAAKERKERMVEEVRRHFGFKVDPKDERFKEMLELKEKEDKKKQKEAKRKAKEEKMLEKLIQKTADQ